MWIFEAAGLVGIKGGAWHMLFTGWWKGGLCFYDLNTAIIYNMMDEIKV